jgi:menaquinone-9 beta-reductase
MSESYDAVIVGASLAGSTAAAFLGRQGARVALVERSTDPNHYKRACTHFIQAHATPTLERLGLAERIEEAGGIRNSGQFYTRWGTIRPELDESYRHPRYGYSIRRETLDPTVRRLAAETDGVDLLLGHAVDELRERDGGRIVGVRARRRDGSHVELDAPLTVAADGRDSRVGQLARVEAKVRPHGRFGYFAHYRGVRLRTDAAAQLWFLEPDIAYTFANDDGVTLLTCMPAKEKLGEFKQDLAGNLETYFEDLPDAPDLSSAERVSPVIGKVDMPNTSRPAAPKDRPGLAFVGDAAMASDVLWGIGCGFAFTTAEWLADEIGPALASGRDPERARRRYGRKHALRLAGHHKMTSDYSMPRPFNPIERLVFSAATRDRATAQHFHALGNRSIGPVGFLSPRALGRAAWVNVRHGRQTGRDPATAAA